MPRSVRVQNISGSDVSVSDGSSSYSVPAFGFASFPYAMYARIALRNDLAALPVRVHIPNEQIADASVKGYGAKGDGVTDDTVAIQRAIDDMEAYGGGSVSLPVGIYAVSSVSIRGSVSLVGESSDSTIIKSSGSAPPIIVSGGNAGICGCTLLGGKCMRLESGASAMVSRCRLVSSGVYYDIADYSEEADSSTLSEEFCVYERI